MHHIFGGIIYRAVTCLRNRAYKKAGWRVITKRPHYNTTIYARTHSPQPPKKKKKTNFIKKNQQIKNQNQKKKKKIKYIQKKKKIKKKKKQKKKK
ncbi:hypothetical protein, partial [Enterobacter hormaechei]